MCIRDSQTIEWASLHHDKGNTGDHSLTIPAQVGPPETDDGDDSKGCGCTAVQGPAGLAWLGLIPLAWVMRRRQACPHAVAGVLPRP